MKKGYTRFVQELPAVTKCYPNLKIVTQGFEQFLRGTFEVIDKEGNYWETFTIEIRHTDDFPFRFPTLREVGGAIPKIADWHIYEDTGDCCITVPAQEILYCRKGLSVKQFIEYHVRPYFFNQAHRKHFGVYANGEYEHGAIGKWQHYFELFGTTDKRLIIQWLQDFLRTTGKVNKKSRCICGSGVRFRKCHQAAYWLLSRSSRGFLANELKSLEATLAFPIPGVTTTG